MSKNKRLQRENERAMTKYLLNLPEGYRELTEEDWSHSLYKKPDPNIFICSICKENYTTLATKTGDGHRVCINCVHDIWQDGKDSKINKWAEKYIVKRGGIDYQKFDGIKSTREVLGLNPNDPVSDLKTLADNDSLYEFNENPLWKENYQAIPLEPPEHYIAELCRIVDYQFVNVIDLQTLSAQKLQSWSIRPENFGKFLETVCSPKPSLGNITTKGFGSGRLKVLDRKSKMLVSLFVMSFFGGKHAWDVRQGIPFFESDKMIRDCDDVFDFYMKSNINEVIENALPDLKNNTEYYTLLLNQISPFIYYMTMRSSHFLPQFNSLKNAIGKTVQAPTLNTDDLGSTRILDSENESINLIKGKVTVLGIARKSGWKIKTLKGNDLRDESVLMQNFDLLTNKQNTEIVISDEVSDEDLPKLKNILDASNLESEDESILGNGGKNRFPYESFGWKKWCASVRKAIEERTKPKLNPPRMMSVNEFKEWAYPQKFTSIYDWTEWNLNDGKYQRPSPKRPIVVGNDQLYAPKDLQKEFGREFTSFEDLLGYKKEKVRKSEEIKEFFEWVLDKIEIFHVMPEGAMTAMFDSQGLISHNRPEIRALVKKIIEGLQEPDGLNKVREWINDFLDLEKAEIKTNRKYTQRQPKESQGVQPVIHESLMQEEGIFSVNDIFKESSKLIPRMNERGSGTLWNIYVEVIVDMLWNQALTDEKKTYEDVNSLIFSNDELQNEIKERWLTEYEVVKNIDVKSSSFQPYLNQKFMIWKMRREHALFCMDRTGSGKTLGSILSSKDQKAQFTLVVCPYNIMIQWMREIRTAYPDSTITTEYDVNKNVNPTCTNTGSHYHVVNYDKFSQDSRKSKGLIDALKNVRPDFVILDEAHNMKIRDDYEDNKYVNDNKYAVKASTRRRNVQGIIDALRTKKYVYESRYLKKFKKGKLKGKALQRLEKKETKLKKRKLNIMLLSATPVINTLAEAKSLLRLLTGDNYVSISTRNTAINAYKLHMEFLPVMMRSKRGFNVSVNGLDPTKASDVNIELGKMTKEEVYDMGFLELEQLATKARLPEIVKAVNHQKTIVYTGYVTGIVDVIREELEKEGYKVGYFYGDDKTGCIDKSKPKNPDGSYFNPFIQGDVDVLIASRSIAEGYDGLQKVCSNLILNGIAWTYAEIEQIVGRLDRSGQQSKNVDVHMIFANIEGKEYDRRVKWDRVEYKRQFANCIVEGVAPKLGEKGKSYTKSKAEKRLKIFLESLYESMKSSNKIIEGVPA